jgi:hypothetical protein
MSETVSSGPAQGTSLRTGRNGKFGSGNTALKCVEDMMSEPVVPSPLQGAHATRSSLRNGRNRRNGSGANKTRVEIERLMSWGVCRTMSEHVVPSPQFRHR